MPTSTPSHPESVPPQRRNMNVPNAPYASNAAARDSSRRSETAGQRPPQRPPYTNGTGGALPMGAGSASGGTTDFFDRLPRTNAYNAALDVSYPGADMYEGVSSQYTLVPATPYTPSAQSGYTGLNSGYGGQTDSRYTPSLTYGTPRPALPIGAPESVPRTLPPQIHHVPSTPAPSRSDRAETRPSYTYQSEPMRRYVVGPSDYPQYWMSHGGRRDP